MKGGLFTCKCDKPNCSFSDETIKSLRIDDSDNEETELDENSEQRKTENNKLPDDKLLIQEVHKTNKTVRNSSRQRTRLSVAKNSLKQKTDCSSPSSSEYSSVTVCSLQINDSKEANLMSIPKNELLGKAKAISLNSILKHKEPSTNESDQLLKVIDKRSSKISGSKLIQDKLKQVVLKKDLGDKLSNGNSSLLIGKKTLTGKKLSVGTTEKQNLCNGSKVSFKSPYFEEMKNYYLRHEALCPHNKIINKSRLTISSDTSIANLKTITNSKNSDQSIYFIETELIGVGSTTKSNMVNGQHKHAKHQRTSASKDVKVETNDESFPHSDQER